MASTRTEPRQCSYQAEYFDHRSKTYELFRCDETSITNDHYCQFHSPRSGLAADEFTNKLITKVSDCMKNEKPIYLIGYIFPYKVYLKVTFLKGEVVLFFGSSFNFHIKNISPIYLPNLEPDLHEAHITQPVYFTHSTFRKGLEIGNIHLTVADFNDVKFEEDVIVAASLIEKSVFENCAFSKSANFSITRMVDSNFSRSHFHNNAKFTGAILYKSTFLGSIFDGLANFTSMTSYQLADFSNITCNKESTFSGSKFLGLSFFQYSVFKERANFESAVFMKRSNFNNVVFEDGEKVTFNACNLSMVTFARTDITRVNFGDVQWRQGEKYKIIDEEDLEWSLKPIIDWTYLRIHDIDNNHNLFRFLRHNGIIDNGDIFIQNENDKTIAIMKRENSVSSKIGSITLTQNDRRAKLEVNDFSYDLVQRDKNKKIFYPLKINIQSVLAIYRNLRENYEYKLRYEEAGKFFLREMEIKRKYNESFENNIMNYYEGYNVTIKNKVSALLSLTGFYYNLARYGESTLIPVIVGISIILTATLLFAFQVNPLLEFSLINATHFYQLSNGTQVGIAFDRSLTDFMPVFFGNPTYKIGTFDYLIKLLGGVFTFGFIAIALRRRFERKIRH